MNNTPLESDTPGMRLLARQALTFKAQRDSFRHCLELLYSRVHVDDDGKTEFDADGYDALEHQIENLLYGPNPEMNALRSE